MKNLDLKTSLFLHITKAKIKKHIEIKEVKDKLDLNISESDFNDVYIFDNYNEYRRFFLMYLDNIDDDVINLAIYTTGSKGQIVSLKKLCEHIIIKAQIKRFYASITEEQENEIHKKGKLTPLEIVKVWEDYDLCASGNHISGFESRCNFFEHNCHECLLEIASHKLEHDNIEFKIVNPIIEEKQKVLEKSITPKKIYL